MPRKFKLIVTWGVICGVGMGFMASVLASTVASTWFVEKRVLVTGLLMGATTAGQLVFMQVHRALIDSQGWRWASIVIAAATLASIRLVVLFIQNQPEDKGLSAYGAPAGYVTPPRRAVTGPVVFI